MMTNVCDFTVFDLIGGSTFTGGDPFPMSVRLSYNADDPFAVSLRFFGPKPVDWVFAREVLADGLVTATGLGDVLIRPADDCPDIEIHLYSKQSDAVFLAPVEDLAEFLDRTYDECPAGAESANHDVDVWLRELFDMEGR